MGTMGPPITLSRPFAPITSHHVSSRLITSPRYQHAGKSDVGGSLGSITSYAFGYERFEHNETRRCPSAYSLQVFGMQGWSRGVAGFLYLLAMVYSFMGVGIITDKFMEAIEVITSKEKVNRL